MEGTDLLRKALPEACEPMPPGALPLGVVLPKPLREELSLEDFILFNLAVDRGWPSVRAEVFAADVDVPAPEVVVVGAFLSYAPRFRVWLSSNPACLA